MQKGSEWMRRIVITVVCLLLLMGASQKEKEDESSLILEVDGDVATHENYIEETMPHVEVVATYAELFTGIAVKGSDEALMEVANLDFVQAKYPVQSYETLSMFEKDIGEKNIPAIVNDTDYTGKGIKVAVIDTGIDYNHPDLQSNYAGGYDLVDLDDDPMETTEGLTTLHGTHVAGIIASDGNLEGVAPDAELYAYRALGPGGMGTSIQIIAAMEEAIKEGVDVINLSLGNTINGPDYPTSKAVSEASKHGVAVVVANGNAGPDHWTVGAPATSQHALSVGAYAPNDKMPRLLVKFFDKDIPLQPVSGTGEWEFDRDYEIKTTDEKVRGAFILLAAEGEEVIDQMLEAEEQGAAGIILYEEKNLAPEWVEALQASGVQIPVATVSQKDGRWLKRHSKTETIYGETVWDDQAEMVAPFSSRGPVTVNWELKPDLIAPGVNIVSTVPDGYEALNGTSMATPHVAGAVALIKEAQPTWSNEQIFQALKTTAKPLKDESNELVAPVDQGTGLLQVDDAIHTDVIIHQTPLTFGFVHGHIGENEQTIELENLSDEEKVFRIIPPRKEKGLSWKAPQEVTVKPQEKVGVPIELNTNSILMEEGIIEGWIKVESEAEKFSLPYIVVNETSDYPKVMGFTFNLNQFEAGMYDYELYVPEEVKSVEIKLYHPNSLLYEGILLQLTDLDVGMNEGQMKENDIEYEGAFYGLIVVELADGDIVTYDTKIQLQ